MELEFHFNIRLRTPNLSASFVGPPWDQRGYRLPVVILSMNSHRLNEEVIFVSRPWVSYASFTHEPLGEEAFEPSLESPRVPRYGFE